MHISSWPFYDDEQIEASRSVLISGKVNYWTGTQTKDFENEFSNYINSKKAIALSNGSLALSSAYLSIGLSKDDEIITTPRTFIATASSAVLLGAKPIFADVDINSGVITPETIEPLITKNTKAISVVHLGGWPAEIEQICKLAKYYKINVIEDCAQAHGAGVYINGKLKHVGSFGDVSAWSFCQDKIISTGGEGGMVTTNKQEIWEKIYSLKDHGKDYNLVHNVIHKSGYKWLHNNLGSNFRLTEFQSSIGRVQLRNLEVWNKKRAYNAQELYTKLRDLSALRLPEIPSNIRHGWYKFYAYVNSSALSSDWDRDRIVCEIIKKGYPAFQGCCSEIYLEKCFVKRGIGPRKRLINAKELGESSLMFLVHPTISKEEIQNYALTIRSVIIEASR